MTAASTAPEVRAAATPAIPSSALMKTIWTEAWARGVKEALSDSSTRGYLIAGMKVPPALAAVVPLPRIVMAKEMSAADVNDFQKFLDLGVELGVVKSKIDAKTLVKAF